jgi:hypothetical protein
MKKNLARFLACILFLVCFSLVACDNENRDSAENSYIELTVDNYDYYLSISKVLTDSGSYAGGSFRYASYQATISGAINGIYDGCIVYYKLGQDGDLQTVTLNAAGFAQFNYTVVNGENIIYTKAEGKIYL